MKKVEIHCSQCNKIGFIEIEEKMVTSSTRGVIAVNIIEFKECNHSFVVYIDKNFDVRDSFTTDFTVKLPQIQIEEENQCIEAINNLDINIYLLMINTYAIEMVYIIRGLLLKKKVLYVNDFDLIYEHLLKLIDFSFHDTFNHDFSVISSFEFNNNKNKFKNHIVIKNKEIYNDKNKVMVSSKIKIESSFIEKFLAEKDNKSSIIILRNEILKVFILSRAIMDFIKRSESKKIDIKNMTKYIQNEFKIKISAIYLQFLFEIIENYFIVKIPNSIKRVSKILF